jgi:hypothetical protein
MDATNLKDYDVTYDKAPLCCDNETATRLLTTRRNIPRRSNPKFVTTTSGKMSTEEMLTYLM